MGLMRWMCRGWQTSRPRSEPALVPWVKSINSSSIIPVSDGNEDQRASPTRGAACRNVSTGIEKAPNKLIGVGTQLHCAVPGGLKPESIVVPSLLAPNLSPPELPSLPPPTQCHRHTTPALLQPGLGRGASLEPELELPLQIPIAPSTTLLRLGIAVILDVFNIIPNVNNLLQSHQAPPSHCDQDPPCVQHHLLSASHNRPSQPWHRQHLSMTSSPLTVSSTTEPPRYPPFCTPI